MGHEFINWNNLSNYLRFKNSKPPYFGALIGNLLDKIGWKDRFDIKLKLRDSIENRLNLEDIIYDLT